MNGCRPSAFRVAPGDGRAQCPVHLEYTRSVTKARQALAIVCGQLAADDGQNLLRGQVEQVGAGARQVPQLGHAPIQEQLTAELPMQSNERTGDGPRSATRDWPTDGMSRHPQD